MPVNNSAGAVVNDCTCFYYFFIASIQKEMISSNAFIIFIVSVMDSTMLL